MGAGIPPPRFFRKIAGVWHNITNPNHAEAKTMKLQMKNLLAGWLFVGALAVLAVAVLGVWDSSARNSISSAVSMLVEVGVAAPAVAAEFDEDGNIVFDGPDGERLTREFAEWRALCDEARTQPAIVRQRKVDLILKEWAAVKRKMGADFPAELGRANPVTMLAHMARQSNFWGIPEFVNLQEQVSRLDLALNECAPEERATTAGETLEKNDENNRGVTTTILLNEFADTGKGAGTGIGVSWSCVSGYSWDSCFLSFQRWIDGNLFSEMSCIVVPPGEAHSPMRCSFPQGWGRPRNLKGEVHLSEEIADEWNFPKEESGRID